MEAAAGEQTKWPGDSDEAYPEIFTIPPVHFHKELKPGMLNEDQFNQFWQEGYVLVPDLLTTEDLEPVKRDIKQLVNELATKLYKAGKISSEYSNYGLFQRLTMIEHDFPGANVILHKQGSLTESFRNLFAHEKLLNVAEQILGTSDIMGHPVWNLRTKTPSNDATTVPWHQDSSYLDNSSYGTMQLTAWIPLLNTNALNGCMQVIKEGHKMGKIVTHTCCHGGTWYNSLSEEEMKKSLGVNMETDVVTCEVPFGGVLFFSNVLPHRSLENMSNDVRWSLDLRWYPAGKSAGFYGLKEGVQLRSATDRNFKVDWGGFDAVNRHEKKQGTTWHSKEDVDEFDTTIPGPWMKKWQIVHMNKHTEAQLRNDPQSLQHIP